MLQQDQPDDYVVAMGVSHSVKDLVEEAFGHVGLDWQEFVHTDPRFLRPAEVDHLIGDPAKARRVLGWEPSVDFKKLVHMMVDADLDRLSRQQAMVGAVAHPLRRALARPHMTVGLVIVTYNAEAFIGRALQGSGGAVPPARRRCHRRQRQYDVRAGPWNRPLRAGLSMSAWCRLA